MSAQGKLEEWVDDRVRKLIGEHAAGIDAKLEALDARIVGLEADVNADRPDAAKAPAAKPARGTAANAGPAQATGSAK